MELIFIFSPNLFWNCITDNSERLPCVTLSFMRRHVEFVVIFQIVVH
jgi:hypothetical protein